MNEPRGTARRLRRIQPDDPRFAACTLWLRTSTIRPTTQILIEAAILKILDETDEFTTWEEVKPEDEVREPGVAEEVPRG